MQWWGGKGGEVHGGGEERGQRVAMGLIGKERCTKKEDGGGRGGIDSKKASGGEVHREEEG